MRKSAIAVAAIFTFMFALVAVPASHACSQPPPEPDIWVDIHGVCCFSDGTCLIFAWITFHNFTTFGSGGSTFCACGLSKVGGIEAVVGAKLVDANTGAIIQEFDFQADSGASASAADLLAGDDVQGFIADIQNSVPEGLNADLMFEVVLADGTTEADVENALLNAGGPTLVAAEADAAGNFTGHVGTLPSGDPNPCTGDTAIKPGSKNIFEPAPRPVPCNEPLPTGL